MDAEPLLRLVARILSDRRLEAVLIGNAAAALQGSPITTLDLDFMFRKTPTNLRKIKGVADDLEAVVMRPYYPTSDLYRVVRDRDGLQLDFMARIDGIRSFERLRAGASPIAFGDCSILVAALGTSFAVRRPLGAHRTWPFFQHSSARSMKSKRRSPRKRSALAKESERIQVDQIRRLLALPPSRRTHFLRKRLSFRGSAL